MTTEQDTPTVQQTKYLGLLLSKAHGKGVPHLPIETLTRRQVSEWIDYLKTVVGEEGANSSPSSTPMPVRTATLGYRPVAVLSATDHQHSIEPWSTEDGWEILECVTCGAQW